MEVDLLLTNAKILTLNENNDKAGSLAVTGGKITGIWPENEPPKSDVQITLKTEVMNLNGATVIPGFIDTHNHLLMYSLNKKKINCSTPPNKNIQDILNNIRKKVNETPRGQWILGYAYDDTLLEDKRHPTRAELDRVAPDHPLYITHISAHLAVANSKALELAGVHDDMSDPKGGHFGRDHNGRLNGVLHEIPAMNFVQNHIPHPTIDEMVEAIKIGAKDYLAQGITTNTDAGVGLTIGESELEAHIHSSQNDINPMRSQLMIMHDLLRPEGKFANYTADRLNKEIQQLSNGKARLDSAKMFQDGSIQGFTGALRKPYYKNQDVIGELLHDQEPFNKEIADLHRRGFRIAIHGNGDRAIGSILEGYEYAIHQYPRKDHRHRIEHVQTATAEDLDRMKKLGVAGSVFINHVYYWGDRHKHIFLGPERATRISPLADMQERNLLFTLHSDCPVTPISPLFSIWAAVNRLTSSGEILGPDQCINVMTALKAMTIYGAQLNFTENEVGSIEVGKSADLAILNQDPMQVDANEIKDIVVEATIIEGDIVYER